MAFSEIGVIYSPLARLINNSLTRRPRTNDRVLSKSELVTEIKKFKNNINCLVYCQRKGAPDVNSHLKNSGILTLNIVRDLIIPESSETLPSSRSSRFYIKRLEQSGKRFSLLGSTAGTCAD